MAQPAKIVPKVFDPLSFAHDGWSTFFDIFQLGDSHYQMVPNGGDRFVTVMVDGQDCVVNSIDTTICSVSAPLQDASSKPNRVVLKAMPSPFPFVVQVHGNKTGLSLIHVSAMDGKRLDTVEISVKDEVQKTYRLWALKDIVRRTTRTATQMISIMNNVAALYKSQANIKLVQTGAPLDLLFKNDLGDPIANPGLTLVRISAGIKLSDASTGNFDIVSTWDIPDAVGQTFTLGGVCLVEDYKPGQVLQETSTYAHELGHAFGLRHTSITNMMMSLDGADSLQMSKFDIDTVNSTGT